MTYGPYATEIPAGSMIARFSFDLDNTTADNLKILTIDVYDSVQKKVLGSKDIFRKDFRAPGVQQDFDVVFTNANSSQLEFRVLWHGFSYVHHSKTTILAKPAAEFRTDPLGALWEGRASFKPLRPLVLPPNESSGWITIKDGIWYFFNREMQFGAKPSYCPLDYARTVVRSSSDKGVTWSQKYVVAEPNPADKKSNCAILDGSTFYDGSTDTWHMLTQCLGDDVAWRLCHFTRKGSSPLGSFTRSQVPAIDGGTMWKTICSGVGKSCPTTTGDEGTPEILYKKDGYFYVTFHGFNAADKTGYRGVARTTNFSTWETVGADLPGDALFSAKDCRSWNQGCIGGGAATMLASGGYNYMMIEAPNISLLCTSGQNWVFGLMRSPALAGSGKWESYSKNPVLKPTTTQACALQYARLFQDGGSTFLIFESLERGTRQIYILQEGTGPAISY